MEINGWITDPAAGFSPQVRHENSLNSLQNELLQMILKVLRDNALRSRFGGVFYLSE